jgi:hypothetical protein
VLVASLLVEHPVEGSMLIDMSVAHMPVIFERCRCVHYSGMYVTAEHVW